jgi:hypothetical protein
MIEDMLDGATRYQRTLERAARDLIRSDLHTLLELHEGRPGTASLILAVKLVSGLLPSGMIGGGIMPISDRDGIVLQKDSGN